MEDIIYRKLEKTDYDEVRNLICEAFGLGRYVPDKKTLDKVKRMYLCSCLAEQKFNMVALYQGEVVGVIMGASKNDKFKLSNMQNSLKLLYYTVSIYLFHKKECGVQGNVHKAYVERIADYNHKFNGVLTLFAVESNLRGLGIGKGLLSKLQAYYNEKNSDSIYLYTDDTCNYGFYEHMGFCRVKEMPVFIIRDNKQTELGVYLYVLKTNQR